MKKFLISNWFTLLVCTILISSIVSIEHKYSKYPNEVEAYLISTYNPDDDKVIVGYGYHGRVYDRPASFCVYNTYEYVVDGNIYTYNTTTVLDAKPIIKLRYADDPNIVIVDNRN